MTTPYSVGEKEERVLRHARQMLKDGDMCQWSDAHDTAVIEAIDASLSALSTRVEGEDAKDAGRWRRLVNASEMAFPVATIADDPENDCQVIYGRKRLEEFIDRLDEISDTYVAISHKG